MKEQEAGSATSAEMVRMSARKAKQSRFDLVAIERQKVSNELGKAIEMTSIVLRSERDMEMENRQSEVHGNAKDGPRPRDLSLY